MKRYRLSKQSIHNLRRRYMWRMAIVFAGFALVLSTLSWLGSDGNLIIRLVIPLAGLLIIGAIGIWRNLKQVVEVWESIQVEIGDDYVARSQVRIPELRIQRDEIVSIDEMKTGLCVRTSEKSRTIAIPAVLDEADFQEIKQRLSEWMPIQPETTKARFKGTFLLLLLIIGFGVTFLSSSFWLVLVVGLVMMSYYVYTYWTIHRVSGVDPKFKRRLLVGVVFIGFLTSMKLWALLMTSGN